MLKIVDTIKMWRHQEVSSNRPLERGRTAREAREQDTQRPDRAGEGKTLPAQPDARAGDEQALTTRTSPTHSSDSQGSGWICVCK